VPLSTLKGVLAGTLQGCQSFLSLNIVNVINAVIFQLFPLAIAIWISSDLSWLLFGAVFAQLITLILLFVQCWRALPLMGVLKTDRNVAVSLFKFGGWVTVTGVVGPLMVILDRFAIGAINGAQAVTQYTVPYNLVNRTTLLSTSLATALFPRFASGGIDEQQRLLLDAAKIILLIMTPLVVFGVLFLEPFLGWWINPEFAVAAAPVGKILLLGVWTNSLAYLPYSQLQAKGRPDLVAKCHLAELLPYLFFLYLALSYWGIIGAAIIWSVRTAIDCFLLYFLSNLLGKTIRIFIFPIVLLGLVSSAVLIFGEDHFLFVSLLSFLLVLLWVAYNAPMFLSVIRSKS